MLLLNTRVTLGTSFCPSSTSGSDIGSIDFLFHVVDGIADGYPLAAEHDGANRNSLQFFIQIRNGERI